jgi:hypothetical protein
VSIQDIRRAIILPLFQTGDVEEELARFQKAYVQLAQQVQLVHNSIQTGTVTPIAGGTTVIVFTWQTPWPVPPSYKVFCAFTWQTTWIFARSANGRTVTITTAAAAGGGDTMLILGVA